MFSPGEVVRFRSYVAGKTKYHLCISIRGAFLFVNSPKEKTYAGDFIVSCTEFPFLEPTESGKSVISCSLLVKMTEAELSHTRACCIGKVSPKLLREVIKFVEGSPVLSPEDKDFVLDELGDWVGF